MTLGIDSRPGALAVLVLATLACHGDGGPHAPASPASDAPPSTVVTEPLAATATPLASASAGAFEAPCSRFPADGERGPFRFGSDSTVEPPRALDYRAPDVRALGLELTDVPGILVVETIVGEDGRVGEMRVVRSAHPEFDRAMLEALRRTRFEPARRDDRPVAVCYAVTARPHP